MRQPSLHITEKELVQVLKKIKAAYNLSNITEKELAALLLTQAKNKSCNNRNIVISNDKLEKKAKTILKSSKGDAVLLAGIIYNFRMKKRHRGITRIDQDSRDWSQLKNLVTVCIQFCNDFGLEKRKGFIKYIELGFTKITSTRQYISKLVNMSETIANEYDAILTIQEDDNAGETRDIHDYYTSLIAQRTGITESYLNNPIKYLNFKKVGEITDSIDIPFEIYITAQFEGLAWASSYPDPNQLTGDKARERLNKYLFENKIRKGTSAKQASSNSLKDALMKLKNGK